MQCVLVVHKYWRCMRAGVCVQVYVCRCMCAGVCVLVYVCWCVCAGEGQLNGVSV